MRNILKQTSWLFFAQVLTRIIGFFYVIYLARVLGVSDFGLYTVALAYFSIISSLADFGFNRFLIREVARDRLQASQLVWNIVILRLTLTSVLFAIFSITLYSLDPDKTRVSLALLATLAILPQSIALTFDAIFVAVQKLQFSAASLFVSSLFTAIAGFLFVNSGFGPMGAINALIFGQVAYLLALIIFLYKFKLLVLSEINLDLIKKAILGSLPYGLLAVLGLFYFRVDILILNYLRGNFEAGIYSAAYKFLEALIFIPSSLSLALFPNMVKLTGINPLRAYKLYLKSTALLFSVSLVIVTVYLLLLPQVIIFFLPQYLPSISVIKILSLTIPFMFMISLQGIVLFSSRKFLRMLIVLSIFNLLLNIAMNLYLIPRYGYFGAAWATLVSDVVGFIIFFFYIRVKLLSLK